MAKDNRTIWVIGIVALIIIGFIYFNNQHPKYLTNDIRYPTYCDGNEDGCTKTLCESSGGEWRTLKCDSLICSENADEMCSCTGVDNAEKNCYWTPNFGCDCRMEAN